MGLFEVGQLFPGGRAILPSATYEPAFCGLMLVSGAIDCDLLLVKGEGIISALEVNEFIQKDILVFVRVTLHMHA